MFQALVSAVSELMIGISCQIKKNFFNYNELHTAISSTILVSDDGSLLSVVEVHGISSLTTPATFANNVLMQLTSSIASNFDTNGHIIQSVFNYEPENAEQQIRDLQAPSRETYRSLEMDVDFVLDENVEALKDIAAREKNYLLLWTTTGILSAQERKASNKKKVARYKEAELPIGTRVIVTGQLDGREVSSYTNKDGQTVPATTEEYVKLDNLAPDLSIMNVLLKVEKVSKEGTTSSTNSTNMNTFTNNTNVTNEADNLFGQTSSTDTTSNQDAEDDPFADLFN